MCRPLKSVYVRQFKTLKSALKATEAAMAELEAIAAETDFSNPAHAEQFSRNVTYLKTYFEHCERLIRGGE